MAGNDVTGEESLPAERPVPGRRTRPTGRIWAKHVFVCTSGDWCPRMDGTVWVCTRA